MFLVMFQPGLRAGERLGPDRPCFHCRKPPEQISSICAGKAMKFVRGFGAARIVRAQFRQKRMLAEVKVFE